MGEELARKLIDAAKISVGSQHSPAHQTGVRYACEDLETLRKRLKQLVAKISSKLEQHQVGKLLTTIAGIGDNTAGSGTLRERWRSGSLRWVVPRTQALRQASTQEFIADPDRQSARQESTVDANPGRCHAEQPNG